MRAPLLFAVPMKDPAISKTRLANAMSGMERTDLALSMLERTLEVIDHASCEKVVLVVTESRLVAAAAEERGFKVLFEGQAEGLNAAATKAAGWGLENGFDRMAILPVDLPLLSSGDVEYLSSLSLERGQVMLCESVDGGTNCLMASPPDAITFRYGVGSFAAHQCEARLKRLTCIILERAALRYDLDTSGDLEAYSALWGRGTLRRVQG